MEDRCERAVAIVGVGAILPDAPSAPAFFRNVREGRYSITEVPPGRWNVADYYDPDPKAPEKTYSKIGSWVRGFAFDWKRFHVPPRVAAAMDEGQQWAVTIAAEALADYGYPDRPIELEKTGVVLGAAMGGELHYLTNLRIAFPEYARALSSVRAFADLPAEVRSAILSAWHERVDDYLPPVTEDTMPGELANIIAGRVANLLDLKGPSFTTDAACASSFAAIDAAVDLLVERRCDTVLAGGVDRNMGVSSFVKFCKIGALSATGTRPFGEGADGFVMGEGSAVFLLKRLADAERDGDRVYAVLRGVGGSSDGKGKGITAPNPAGQMLAIQRAWHDAGLDPATATLVEAHGTSTKVGDVVEVESLAAVFSGAPHGAIALGSAKSNVGHLKAGAGAAGLLKTVYALHEKVLPPTLHAERPNPAIDFASGPFRLSTDLRPWERNGVPRRAGVSAYGFGGTNFHLVLEEHVPGALTARRPQVSVPETVAPTLPSTPTPPLRGVAAIGASSVDGLRAAVEDLLARVRAGFLPPHAPPDPATLAENERVVVDFGSRAELQERLEKTLKALSLQSFGTFRPLKAQGIFRGTGPAAGKIAFLFPGQGSQYANMGRELAECSPAVASVFEEADRVMAPLLGKPLTKVLFADPDDLDAVKEAEEALKQTAVTQPAVLTIDAAMAALLRDHGFAPDYVMGHSLGEYGALVAAGVLPFADAVEASAARGREMTRVSLEDNGWMAAVMAPLPVIEETLATIEGYVVACNVNSIAQCVIGGETEAVKKAIEAFTARGYNALRIPVSHAFHTRIVAPASEPLRKVLDRLHVKPPELPIVANVTGGLYPTGVEEIKDLLVQQIAAPVQWVKGLETLYAAGVRTFVEVGPKKALTGFVEDVLGGRPGVVALFTNHPKPGEIQTFNHALCGLWAAGYGASVREEEEETVSQALPLDAVRQLLAEALKAAAPAQPAPQAPIHLATRASDRNEVPLGSLVISGTGLGLPGAEKPVMDPSNAERILRGEQFVDLIPERFRQAMAARNVTRVVKSEDGSGHFETIQDTDGVIKLAGRPGAFDLSAEYGVPAKLVEAFDVTTQLAIAAGLDALREAGIPLVQTYKKTTTGKWLPERWMLPESLRDETGVVFASAFPGYDRFADEMQRYFTWESRRTQMASLEDLRLYTQDPGTLREIQRRSAELTDALAREPYTFDRRFLFRVLSMGHSQFAELIGARGPNTQVNSACASTALAIGVAEDWIRSGRCRRVVVIGADDASGEALLPWIGAGFLATGAAATDHKVEEAALPFDRRRHGTLLGMGACALVVESQDAVSERGMRGIVELLASETRNSAYHGTRLDVNHIADAMNSLITSAERRFGLSRHVMAPETVFMSHETFTPARGGSASAEVTALRQTFGPVASEIVMANTKGFTGHPMGVGIEDVIAVKILEHGIVPPVPNFQEVDPELGPLTLSRGGRYPVKYAIHLAAGFGSQIALTLTRRIPGGLDRVDDAARNRRWLADVAGYDRAETEVVLRVLRVVAHGAPERQPAPSPWTFGLGPVRRAPAPGDGRSADARPAPMVIQAAPAHPGAPLPVTPPAPRPGPAPAPEPVRAPAPPPPVAVAPPPPPVPAPAPAPAEPTGDPIVTRVLAIVAEKTGYPPEMLDLELDLEADLGVDTVKQAEVFAAVRAAWDIPRQENLKLRDFPTLKHVVKFVLDNRPDLAGAKVAAKTAASASTPTAQAPAPTPAAMTVAAPTPEPAGDPVIERVLAIVAEKTGYPPEMLDLELDLEADLGVDTVKQAEVFAAVRAAWEIPRQESLKLRDFPTLKHVVRFVFDNRPDLVRSGREPHAPATPTTSKEPAPPEEEPRAAAPTAYPVEGADRVPRRLPVPVLRPSLDLCLPTGVTLGPGSRVVVMPDRGGVASALVARLVERGVTIVVLEGPAMTALAIEGAIVRLRGDGPIDGLYWLPALDPEPALPDLSAFREETRRRVKGLYTAARALEGETGPFLISATRLGGLHGYGPEGAANPIGGGVSGFTKAWAREHDGTLAKVVDVEAAAEPAAIADALLAETLRDPGVVEIGLSGGLRWAIAFEERPARDGSSGMTLDRSSVFLVTGAAGGITSAIVADLAAASGGTFHLLDLVPEPDRGDPRIALLRRDREALKRLLIDEAKGRGEKPTPVAVEKQVLIVERADAALRAIEAVEAAGGTAFYRSVDLRDGAAVTAAVDDVRSRHGKLDVLLHAGGVEISRKLADKEPGEFDLVFDIKADGFYSLLAACAGMPLGATVCFSSVAGRFGNSGQVDYSAANDLLCKWTSHLRAARPETRAIAIDWTAWGGIGMATRGSIPKLMEMAGIEMLPPEVGIPTIRRELTAGAYRGEVIVAGRLGSLVGERGETGGLDVAAANAALAGRERPYVMLGKVTAWTLHGGLQVETTLDPSEQPFLFDHKLDGTPLLPGAMGTEAFAELASVLAPGLSVFAVEDAEFLSPLKFHRMKPATLHLAGRATPGSGGTLVVDAALRSIHQARPEHPAQERLHFKARVRMSHATATAEAHPFTRPPREALPVEAGRVYEVFFHGPAYQVVEAIGFEDHRATCLMAHGLPVDTAPEDADLLVAPRLIELGFQAASLWILARQEVLALPAGFRSVTAYRSPAEANGSRLHALVTAHPEAASGTPVLDARIVDDAGQVYLDLLGYQTVALPGRQVLA